MHIVPKDLEHQWHKSDMTCFQVNLGLDEPTEVSIYNPGEAPVSRFVLDTLSYIKDNLETLHVQCRKLIFDYVQNAANDDDSGYDFEVAGDWDLLEILEDGESAELIEGYISLDGIDFGATDGECLIHYETAWDHHGMQIHMGDNHSLEML